MVFRGNIWKSHRGIKVWDLKMTTGRCAPSQSADRDGEPNCSQFGFNCVAFPGCLEGGMFKMKCRKPYDGNLHPYCKFKN